MIESSDQHVKKFAVPREMHMPGQYILVLRLGKVFVVITMVIMLVVTLPLLIVGLCVLWRDVE